VDCAVTASATDEISAREEIGDSPITDSIVLIASSSVVGVVTVAIFITNKKKGNPLKQRVPLGVYFRIAIKLRQQ
jgi:hypothetical protein